MLAILKARDFVLLGEITSSLTRMQANVHMQQGNAKTSVNVETALAEGRNSFGPVREDFS